ncbi:zona pelucida superfamily protein qsm isoform X2 [Rhodnius prolixus]
MRLYHIFWIYLVHQLVACNFSAATSNAKVQHKVRCNRDSMIVEIRRTDDINNIYLEGLKYFTDVACQPTLVDHQAVFKLSLTNFYQCGVTRMIQKSNNLTAYYHRIILESGDNEKHVLQVKCLQTGNHTIVKRNVLPAGFQEPIDLDITSSLTEVAPQPKLQVGVRQAGKLVSGELNVNPGTPLQMEIYLDKTSAPVYGLLVSYMQVSDTKAQEETIIFNGCSVDPYLFENFNTVDGDFLTAKFRAFKFPDSTYVQFKGTVNVCLDKCRGIECSNGQMGYGRKKREIPEMPPDPNKVFEVSITSFIKVDYKGDKLLDKVKLDLGADPLQTLETINNGTGTVREVDEHHDKENAKMAAEEELREDLVYTLIEERNSSSQTYHSSLIVSLATILIAFFNFSL